MQQNTSFSHKKSEIFLGSIALSPNLSSDREGGEATPSPYPMMMMMTEEIKDAENFDFVPIFLPKYMFYP